MWITEDNMDATEARANGLPAADVAEFKAKAALRIYAAYGSEGVQAIDLFGAGKNSGACCQLISNAFFQAADRGRAVRDRGAARIAKRAAGAGRPSDGGDRPDDRDTCRRAAHRSSAPAGADIDRTEGDAEPVYW